MTADNKDISRRSKKLINKKFQYHFMLVTGIGALILLNVVIAAAMIAYGPALLGGVTVTHTLTLVLAEFVVVAALMYVSISQSHKVAGPIFVFERAMRSIEEGDLTVDIRLRGKDEFHECAHLFNTCIGSLRTRIVDIKADLSQLDSILDGDTAEGQLVESLLNKIDGFKI